jgi:lysozyme family protein
MTRDEAIALMLQLEGGEANVKGDPGGHTKYGITQATLDSVRWRSFPIVLPANVTDLLPGDAAYIYRGVHWCSIRGDDLPPTLAPLVLNAAVNMGEPRAVMLLQEAVGAPTTGNLGNLTLAAIRSWRSPYGHGQTLAEEYAAHVAARYAFIDNKNAVLTQFELGWFRRLFRVYTLAVSTLTKSPE